MREIVINHSAMGQNQGMSAYRAEDHGNDSKEKGDSQIDKLIPSITEWAGVFSLGLFAGLFAFKTNSEISSIQKNNHTKLTTRNVIIAIAILSMSVGIIHVLLVPEHSNESLIWGVIFLTSGIAQIGFGVFILLLKNHSLRKILYYVGIVGNALLAVTFIAVRIVTPPFSPEQSPINELEPNGIITLIIEIMLVVLLAYQLKHIDDIK